MSRFDKLLKVLSKCCSPTKKASKYHGNLKKNIRPAERRRIKAAKTLVDCIGPRKFGKRNQANKPYASYGEKG